MKFTVYGTPKPQGSMKAFFSPGMKHAVLTSDNKKLKPWRQQITQMAISLGVPPLARDVPVELNLDFYFQRPKSAKKRRAMTVKPDRDKLERAVCDALTGVLYVDDSQVVAGYTRKHYGDVERVEIEIGEAL